MPPVDAVEAYRAQCMSDVASNGAFPDRAKANEYCLGIARSNAANDEKLRKEAAPMAAAANQKFDQLQQEDRARRAAHAKQFADAEAASQREQIAKSKNPSFARARLSALLCYASGERRKYQGQIDEQKRGAKIGGVINKQQVYEAQQEIVAMDELSESTRRSLKSARTKPTDCRKIDRTELEAFFACIDGQRSDAVDDSAAESMEQITAASVPCAAERTF